MLNTKQKLWAIIMVLTIIAFIDQCWRVEGGFTRFVPFTLVVGLIFYVFFRDYLLKLASDYPGESFRDTKKHVRELTGVLAIIIPAIFVLTTNIFIINSGEYITSEVVRKDRYTSGRGLGCNEIELKDSSVHCVSDICWAGVEKGSSMKIESKHGLFGVRVRDVSCEIIDS